MPPSQLSAFRLACCRVHRPDYLFGLNPDYGPGQGPLVVDVAGVAGRVAARLKADGDANRSMLFLTAKAAREIVEAIEASAESFAKAMEANTEAWKRLGDKMDGKTDALKRVEDLIPTRGKERHDEDV